MTEPSNDIERTANGNITPAQGAEPEPAAIPARPPSLEEEPFAPTAAQPTTSPDELRALQEKAAKAEAHYDLYLRTRAELENFRRRSARERQDAVRFASQGLIEKLLPVVDNFEMAMAAVAGNAQGNLDALRQGVAMVQGQLRAALTDAGVQEIDATGGVFDPNQHEAVSQLESTEVPEGHVLQQLRKGYRLHDRLIRPASVVVAKPPGT